MCQYHSLSVTDVTECAYIENSIYLDYKTNIA